MTPSPRRSHSVELVDNKLYTFGGGDGKQALNDLYCLDIETAKWTKIVTRGATPPKRGYHKSVLVGKTMYIIGGSDGSDAFSDVHMLDTVTHTWSKSRAKGAELLASTATLLGNYISLFGGHSPTAYVNSFQCLDIRTTKWYTPVQTGVRPSPRAYHTASLCHHRMWIVGGYDTVKCYSDVHMLDLGSFASQEYAY
jgi:N-acetylneuraminic acid mutarotase